MLATFIMEGGSGEKYTRAWNLFHKEPKTFAALMEKLTAAVTAYLKMQIEAGVMLCIFRQPWRDCLRRRTFRKPAGAG